MTPAHTGLRRTATDVPIFDSFYDTDVEAARIAQGLMAFWSCEGDNCAFAYEFDGDGGVDFCSPFRVAGRMGALARARERRHAPLRARNVKPKKTVASGDDAHDTPLAFLQTHPSRAHQTVNQHSKSGITAAARRDRS